MLKQKNSIICMGCLSIIIVLPFYTLRKPTHLRSREAFISWAIRELESPESFKEAPKEYKNDEVVYTIDPYTYIVLENGESMYFMTHSSHADIGHPIFGKVGDIALIRCGDSIYCSDDHICGWLSVFNDEEYFADFDDFINTNDHGWRLLDNPDFPAPKEETGPEDRK